MDILRLIDEPLSLSKESFNLLLRTHLGTNSSFFKRAQYHAQNKDKELFKFFHNYFSFGLPIFESDMLLANQVVVYEYNPIEWFSDVENQKLEILLCYFYMKKYVQKHLNPPLVSWEVVEGLNNNILLALQHGSYREVINDCHKIIMKCHEYLNRVHQVNCSGYRFDQYIMSRDLNVLFKICHELYFLPDQAANEENVYLTLPISHHLNTNFYSEN